MTDAELLAILLRTGPKGKGVLGLAKDILKKFPDAKLAQVNVSDLKVVYGIGLAKACEIVACFELGRRFLRDKKSVLILTPRQVWEELKVIRSGKKEHFVVFYLDTQNQVIVHDTISVGTLNSSLIHPREVFESAISHSAAHIILAHNHPSGGLEPSEADISITRRLVDAGRLLGIEVLDHVIVTAGGYMSFKEKSLL